MNEEQTTLKAWLQQMSQMDASELHLAPGLPPIFRVGGNLVVGSSANLKPEDVENLLAVIIPVKAVIAEDNTLYVSIDDGTEHLEGAMHREDGRWAASFTRTVKQGLSDS